MNRRFHRWLDDHEIVRFLLVVTVVAAPSLLLCLVGLFLFDMPGNFLWTSGLETSGSANLGSFWRKIARLAG